MKYKQENGQTNVHGQVRLLHTLTISSFFQPALYCDVVEHIHMRRKSFGNIRKSFGNIRKSDFQNGYDIEAKDEG